MFEHIHFSKNFSSLDLSADEVRRQLEQRDNYHTIDQYSTADFHIHGLVRALSPYPIRPEKREHYIFLQDFTYMKTNESYYSRQQNYPSYQLLYTYSGKAEMKYQGKNWPLVPGTVFLADCKAYRSVKAAAKSWESADLHFYGGNSDFLYKSWFCGKTPVFTVKDALRFQTLLEDVLLKHTTVAAYREWNVSNAIENLLLFILGSGSETGCEIPERIQYLCTYLENNFTKPLTLDMLAEFAGLSKYHLAREFKRFIGFSPYAYITELRIHQAKSMLLQTSLPASRIAVLSGFEDESDFFRMFRKKTSMTPNEFRKENFKNS